MKKIKLTGNETGRKRRRLGNVLLAWAIVIAVVALCIFVGVKIMMNSGYKSLQKNATSSGPNLGAFEDESDEASEEGTVPVPTEKPEVWKDSWVSFNGKVYEYNESIMTFMVLGIDKDGKVKKNPDKVSGGQSDAIFLMIVNPDDKSIKLLGINRDTIVDVVMVGIGKNGEDVIAPAQITTQHGFGDGMSQSCELTRDAVSTLLYDLPIHGYFSLNMGAVAGISSDVGGIKLTVLGDMSDVKSNWKEGKEITLKGQDTMLYVRSRDCEEFESARYRLARQKQLLSVMGKQVLQKTKENLTFPLTLYSKYKSYIVTDFTADEITWLAGELVNYSFDSNEIYTMEGTTEMGERFEEFYPDKKALKELMIKLFYKEVNVEEYN